MPLILSMEHRNGEQHHWQRWENNTMKNTNNIREDSKKSRKVKEEGEKKTLIEKEKHSYIQANIPDCEVSKQIN